MHARRERADGDEADLAEREHARVADEDVDRDDDRHRDERVEEVDLVRGETCVATSPTATTSAAGPTSCDERVERRLTRAPPPPAPAARTARPGAASSTRMTSAKTAEGRKTVLSVGSAPLITPVAKPIAKPPSVAVQSRSIPPTTTPTSTTIVSRSAKSGVDERVLDGQDHRDGGGEHAGEERRRSRSRGWRGRRAAARSEVGRGRAHVQADRRPREQQREQRRARRAATTTATMRDLADVDAARR